MTDVWHLKSCGTPGWIESGQINAITQVSGEKEDKGTQPVCMLTGASGAAWAPGLLLHAWNGRQMNDLTSATSPWGPHRCLAKSPGRSALWTWPQWMWWMPRLTSWGGCRTARFMCSVSSPSKAPCHFLLGQTCPAGLTWKSTPSACPIWKPLQLPSLFAPLLNSFFPLLSFSFHTHTICQCYQLMNDFRSDPFVCKCRFISQLIGNGCIQYS